MRFNENLYAAIEDAVKNNTFLNMEQIKQHKHLLRTWGNESDLTFTIDSVYWMDKARNVYIPLLSISSVNGFTGLKVTGKVTLDNWSYGKVGIFRKENRYTSVFRKMEERKMKMTEKEYEELILRFKWMAEKVDPVYKNEVENLVKQYEKEYEQYVVKY